MNNMKQLKFNPEKNDLSRKIKLQEQYFNKVVDGHGGSCIINYDTGRVTTDYIGSKNKIQLIFINIYLWYIWRFK